MERIRALALAIALRGSLDLKDPMPAYTFWLLVLLVVSCQGFSHHVQKQIDQLPSDAIRHIARRQLQQMSSDDEDATLRIHSSGKVYFVEDAVKLAPHQAPALYAEMAPLPLDLPLTPSGLGTPITNTNTQTHRHTQTHTHTHKQTNTNTHTHTHT